MTAPTKQKYHATQAVAMQIVARESVRTLDALSKGARVQILRLLAEELTRETRVSYKTARLHVARAVRRQRNPAWDGALDAPADLSGWGGQRPDAGRPARRAPPPERFVSALEKLVALADALPTGAHDPRALEKLDAEVAELLEKIEQGDRLGALLEAADVAYYAAKSWHTGTATLPEIIRYAVTPAELVGVSVAQVLDAAVAKYTLRARPGNPKDDAAERAAVAALGIL